AARVFARRLAAPACRSDAAVALLPVAPRGDPERHHDQSEIEPEAGALEVQAIQPELARAIDVARRVDLRDAGQSRPDAVPCLVARNLVEAHELAVAADFDFTRPQRPRTDEAHVAGEDVPELRQLVHRGRA